ncbi:hypothetical protein C6988_06515 [Nitrosopumilus sp. b1]|uniref:MBL fold metallo-hydrolase n=1 Tax=Nitrosopumilus sp. b1 TaxID=2109907 RepID=UPI001C70F3CA|nr:hypothetical protein [Nitrosopumilus sp. b1]KAF6242831.1 hypothetical protein C6988_06515 [Nitrosopumilus sp. b1]
MFTFKNYSNAFSTIKTDKFLFVLDPWTSKGIFDGGWAPYPPLKTSLDFLENVTHCFPSHIHTDHFDMGTISRFPKSTKMIVPEVYPNHIMISKIEKAGFTNITILKRNQRIEIEKGIFAEVVPPLNTSGLEFSHIKPRDISRLAIDTGIILEIEDIKLVLLADNTPYNPHHIKPLLEKMKGCDLLGFNYNGAASDYPLCYNMTTEEKNKFRDSSEMKREESILKFIKIVSPKNLMPYSSEFVVMGPKSLEFAKHHLNGHWIDKKEVAERYQKNTGIPTWYLYEDDAIKFENGKMMVNINTKEIPSLLEIAKKYYSPESEISKLSKGNLEYVKKIFPKAVKNMFEKCDLYNLKPFSRFVIEFSDNPPNNFVIDFKSREISYNENIQDNYLKCVTPMKYFEKMLTRETSWNSGYLSFQLNWERKPDVFDNDFFMALNFLTLSRDDLSNKEILT